MDLTRELTISELEGGAVIERLDHALAEVLKDCANINKVPDSVREINCKIKIKPDETRSVLLIGIDVNPKFGKSYPVMAKAFLDESTGKAFEPTAKQGELFEAPIQNNGTGNMKVIGGSQE